MTPAEEFMTEVLNCGINDLELLEQIYSPLAKEVMANEGLWVKDLYLSIPVDLNELLYTLYRRVIDEIVEHLKKRNCTNELINNILVEPYTNCLDSSFASYIDQVIDWNASVESNVEALIEYWRRHNQNVSSR